MYVHYLPQMDVHFTEPYYNTGLRLFTRADEVSGGWFGFVKPFRHECAPYFLWLMLVGVVGVTV
jgi:hypothetical protein